MVFDPFQAVKHGKHLLPSHHSKEQVGFPLSAFSKDTSSKLAGLFSTLGLGTHSFVKVPRPGNSEGIFSNHSKVEAIPLSALPKDTTSELASLSSR